MKCKPGFSRLRFSRTWAAERLARKPLPLRTGPEELPHDVRDCRLRRAAVRHLRRRLPQDGGPEPAVGGTLRGEQDGLMPMLPKVIPRRILVVGDVSDRPEWYPPRGFRSPCAHRSDTPKRPSIRQSRQAAVLGIRPLSLPETLNLRCSVIPVAVVSEG